KAVDHGGHGRDVDPSGAAAWGRVLGTSDDVFAETRRVFVAQGIVNSLEAERDRVQDFYLRFLHRPADFSGLQAFVQAEQRGVADDLIISAFLASPEYDNLIQHPVPPAVHDIQPPTIVIQSPVAGLITNHTVTLLGKVA